MNQAVKKESFYQVTREEILMLRKNGLINNAALVFFAIKLENPFCDRPVKIKTKEFAVSWGIPESSLYAAIAKLKELKVIKTGSAELTISWATHSQQESDSRNLESTSESENELQNVRGDSRNPGNEQLKPFKDRNSSVSHTVSDSSDFKEKKTGKLTKRKDKEIQAAWFDLARAQGIVAAQTSSDRLVTGVNYELGPGCTRQVQELMKKYPIEQLQAMIGKELGQNQKCRQQPIISTNS